MVFWRFRAFFDCFTKLVPLFFQKQGYKVLNNAKKRRKTPNRNTQDNFVGCNRQFNLSAAALQGLREGEGVLEFRDGVHAQKAFFRLGAELVIRGKDPVL